ncbi:MAG: ethanolamine ammonia-lyase reactivating factor EutA [archaeon]
MSSNSKILRSVGIDIGSTTTHLVFSELTFELDDEKHKFEIVGRDITYLSKISLTPWEGSNNINVEKLSSFLFSQYKDAGYSPKDIDTGAIIVTGEAARRQNAEKIVKMFSDQTGKFVCATAGPNYEAVLAAHGSGAVERSEKDDVTIMNVDIGGGTSKIAIAHKGEVVDTASIYVGARPIVIDKSGRVLRIETPANILAKTCGVQIVINKTISESDQRKIAAISAKCLCELINRSQLSDVAKQLLVTSPLSYRGRIDRLTFSGGVAEYIYGCTTESYGDIGKTLGEAIRKASETLGIPILEPVEKIRATVIGVSQYTLQVSGNTTFISDSGLLPMRSVPVVSPDFASDLMTEDDIKAAIRKALEMHDVAEDSGDFALAFRRSVISHPSYEQMKTFGRAILSAAGSKGKGRRTLVLVFEADIGMGMGRVIHEELEPDCNLVSIDEIRLQDFNFVDIGEPEKKGNFIPVVIKSLVFPNQG